MQTKKCHLRSDSEHDGVGNLTGGTRDENTLGLIVEGWLVDSHGAGGCWGHAAHGVSEVLAEVGDHRD